MIQAAEKLGKDVGVAVACIVLGTPSQPPSREPGRSVL